MDNVYHCDISPGDRPARPGGQIPFSRPGSHHPRRLRQDSPALHHGDARHDQPSTLSKYDIISQQNTAFKKSLQITTINLFGKEKVRPVNTRPG